MKIKETIDKAKRIMFKLSLEENDIDGFIDDLLTYNR